ncbi:DUF3029 family protein, partial [Vibrio vulnificus]
MSNSLALNTDRFRQIINDPKLTVKQKNQFLALEAEALLDYMPVSEGVQSAMKQGIICDMFEGNAPFKPRYVLPDYARYLSQGSAFLELDAANDFDDALNMLTVLYHHVPSVTNIPVYLGQLDELLMPYVGQLSDAQIYQKLRRF